MCVCVCVCVSEVLFEVFLTIARWIWWILQMPSWVMSHEHVTVLLLMPVVVSSVFV